MSDRTNRIAGAILAVVLLAIGGLGLSVALGAWGHSAPVTLVDPIVVRWWHDGGWKSFASLAFIGLVLFGLGLSLAWAELGHRGQSPLGDFEALPRTGVPDGPRRGLTTVRAAPLRRALESDLRAIDGVQHASVSLLGEPGELELRARLDVGDRAELASIGDGVLEVAERLALTIGFGPDLVEVTIALVPEPDQRVS
jgi:hypothetical protein